jgi:hypothetical protein
MLIVSSFPVSLFEMGQVFQETWDPRSMISNFQTVKAIAKASSLTQSV